MRFAQLLATTCCMEGADVVCEYARPQVLELNVRNTLPIEHV